MTTSKMLITALASALAAASLPAQAQLSSHDLSVTEARLLTHSLVYEKYCGPLGPQSQWDQKRWFSDGAKQDENPLRDRCHSSFGWSHTRC
jgi:hypothetical protein